MARYYESEWSDYVSVAERRRKAERAAVKLGKKGSTLLPVVVEGRKLTSTFWGKAWCDNLESYRDYENRLERGRSYVRNGLVIDLQVAPHTVTAMVAGTSVYTVRITIAEVPKPRWKSICADCSGGIDSLVELLQGRFSKAVMERICRQGVGLFPKPSEIKFSCSCPDHALMCKHVGAALYGVGVRLDVRPELLFRLRGVDEHDLLADAGSALPIGKQAPAAAKVLQADDMAALFGLDMGDVAEPVEAVRAKPDATRPTPRKAAVTVSPGSAGKAPGAKKNAGANKTPAAPERAKTAAPAKLAAPKATARKTAAVRKTAASGRQRAAAAQAKVRLPRKTAASAKA